MEKSAGGHSEEREKLGGKLAGGDRNGRHRKQKRREALMKLLHRENNGGDGGTCYQRESGRSTARHNVASPALVLFAAEEAHGHIADTRAHLYARAFGAKRKAADKRKNGGKGKHENA